MKGRRGKERKMRSDKKVDVKPTMSLELKNQLYYFAHLCEEPVKNVAQRLCEKGAMSEYVIEEVQKWFRRDYHYKNHIVRGFLERPRLKIIMKGEIGKVTIKFPQKSYDLLSNLAYALDLTPTSTATVLIRICLKNIEFMETYVQQLTHLDDKRVNEIEMFLKVVWGYK